MELLLIGSKHKLDIFRAASTRLRVQINTLNTYFSVLLRVLICTLENGQADEIFQVLFNCFFLILRNLTK